MARAPQLEKSVSNREQPLNKDGIMEEMAIPAIEAQAVREEPIVTQKMGALLTS